MKGETDMSCDIKRIYELTNLEILTPHNLLDNIQLDNYREIKYYKEDQILICEMISIEDDDEVRYLYEFSMDNKLQKATILLDSERMEIFNRSKELKNVIKYYEERTRRKIGS